MKNLLLYILLIVLLAGCAGSPTGSPTQAVTLPPTVPPATATPRQPVVITATASPVRAPSATPTTPPTITPTPTMGSATRAALQTLAPLEAFCPQPAGGLRLAPNGKRAAGVCRVDGERYALRILGLDGKVYWEYSVTDLILPHSDEETPPGGWRLEPFYWAEDNRSVFFVIPLDGESTRWAGILRMDAVNGVVELLFPRQPGIVYALAFSPDGYYLAYASTADTIPRLTVRNLLSGEERSLPLGGDDGAVTALRWTADGRQVEIDVLVDGQPVGYLFTNASGKVEQR